MNYTPNIFSQDAHKVNAELYGYVHHFLTVYQRKIEDLLKIDYADTLGSLAEQLRRHEMSADEFRAVLTQDDLME